MIYGAFNTKTGLIEVKILDGGDSVSTEVIDIGSLKYEFDLLPDGPEVDAVQALYNKISITIFQYAHTKEDLYDRLLANVVAEDGVKVDLVVDGDVSPLFIKLQDIKLSEAERTITLDCRVLYDSTATVIEVFDDIQTKAPALLHDFLPDPNNESEILDATGVLDWVHYAMQKVFLNDLDSKIYSAPTGLPLNYTSENFVSLASGLPDNRIMFLMARMIPSIFSGHEDYQAGQERIRYLGDDEGVTPRGVFSGQGFEGILKPGYKIKVTLLFERLTPPPYFNDEVELIVDEVESDELFYTTEVPTSQGVEAIGGTRFYEYAPDVTTERLLAIDALKEIAAIEGSIFGTGFGKNFYINRIQQSDIVEIDWQDILNQDIEHFNNRIGGGLVAQLARTYTDAEAKTKNQGAENFGIYPVEDGQGNYELPLINDGQTRLADIPGNESRINLRLPPGYPFMSKGLADSGNNVIVGKYELPMPYNLDFAGVLRLCRTGLVSIYRALSTDGSALMIEFEVLGTGSIRPWNTLEFGGVGLPDRYADKRFRPTSLEYDFVMDTVSVKAYQILESDAPDPSNNIEVYGSTTSTGTVVTAKRYASGVQGETMSTGSVATNKV